MTQVNTTIANLRLTNDLADRIRDFVNANQEGLESQQEMKKFMTVISPSLRGQVINYDFYDLVQRQDTFGYDQRVVDMILERMSVIFQKPGEMVTIQSQFNDKICFLSCGFIDVQKTFDFVE